MMSADLPFSSVLAFLAGRGARVLSGLVLGLFVVVVSCRDSLATDGGGFLLAVRDCGCWDWACVVLDDGTALLFLRDGLGETSGASSSSLLLPAGAAAVASSLFCLVFFSGEEKRKFFRVFLGPVVGLAASPASMLSESSTTRRLRRFAGGAIAGVR